MSDPDRYKKGRHVARLVPGHSTPPRGIDLSSKPQHQGKQTTDATKCDGSGALPLYVTGALGICPVCRYKYRLRVVKRSDRLGVITYHKRKD